MSPIHSLSPELIPLHTPPLPSSHDAYMPDLPDVFVIPPEEEHDENPPWCAFDASKAAEENMYTTADIGELEAALSDIRRRTEISTLPLHPAAHGSPKELNSPRSKGYLRRNDIAVDGVELDSWRRQDVRARGLGTEIVEVIKVRRNEAMSDFGDGRNTGMKKSTTFRSRASRALKSIKNVGRSSQKTTYVDSWHPDENAIRAAKSMDIMDARSVPRSSSPNLARRKSLQFTQLFNFAPNKSLVVVEELNSPSSPSMSHTCPELATMSPTESTSSHSTQLHPSISVNDSVEDSVPSGRISPSPTLHRKKSFRERLSILDLHRLFTPSSSSSPSSTSSSSSSDLSESSTGESLGTPTTPRNEEVYSHSIIRAHSFDSKDDPSLPMPTPPLFPSARQAPAPSMDADTRDLSIEMKLDSLHFDSLRFDPEEF